MDQEQLTKLRFERLEFMVRRQEQRRLETVTKLLQDQHASISVANTKVVHQLAYRYPRSTFKHWLILQLIAYVSIRTEQVLGDPYFIFELANKWVKIESKWKKLTFFGYWEKMGVITRDLKIQKTLSKAQHPWGKIIKRHPYYVNKHVLELVLADYAEELANFFMVADLDIEKTPRFIPANFQEHDRTRHFAKLRTKRAYNSRNHNTEIGKTFDGVDQSFVIRAPGKLTPSNPLHRNIVASRKTAQKDADRTDQRE